MPNFGNIGEFSEKKETWEMYVDRLDEYFAANAIADADRKRAILNSIVGPDTYTLMSSLLAPKKPKEATYQELTELLKKHFIPVKSTIVSRYKFNTRSRKPGESVQDFIAAIRTLAKDCKFGTTLNEMLRDRIVCGINDPRIQKNLLATAEDKLDLQKSIDLAQSMELAYEQSKVLQSQTTSHNVDSLRPSSQYKGQRYSNKPQKGKGARPKDSRNSRPNVSTSTTHASSSAQCGNCGTRHPAHRCPANGKECLNCKKMNHFAKYCRSRPQKHVHSVGLDPDDSYNVAPAVNEQFHISNLDDKKLNFKQDIHSTLTLNSTHVSFQLDTGARCNVLPLKFYDTIAKPKSIDCTKTTTLKAFGGTELPTIGEATLPCQGGSSSDVNWMNFHIVDAPVKAILGLNDCLKLGLISVSNQVHMIRTDDPTLEVNKIYTDYADLFDDSLGKLPVVYSMKVDPSVTPVVRPPRRIPAAMQDKVCVELDRMTKIGVITPVSEPTDWVSSMVATHKKQSDEIRLCIDPRDLNHAIKRPHHPTRTVEEVAVKMKGATVFSVLDAKASFWQIPLDHESSLLTTFSTPSGRYRFLRMPYGISSASDVFQRTMEQLFGDLPCEIIVDDILIGGRNKKEHDRNLRLVLDRAREIGLRLNIKKCRFGVREVSYVGHVFTSNGLQPDPAKVSAITNMPPPEDVPAIQRFLGMVTYLAKFVPNLSEVAAPLRELTHNNVHWCWMDHHNKAFNNIKDKIANAPTLKYFDVHKPITVTCDASKFGLGAACLQDGTPVAYASRTMSDTEQRYAQIEKELLAVLFACTRFHDYIYGQNITVETDHQPLVTIIKKPLHSAPARLQRMLLQLQKYHITLIYKKGKELFIADTLSRAPNKTTQSAESYDLEVMTVLSISDNRMAQLRAATDSDTVLQKLIATIHRGWPHRAYNAPPETRPYFPFRDELTTEQGIVLKGQKAVIPKSLQTEYARILHEGHPGTEATKRRARDLVYWPTMSKDIEQLISSCTICNTTKPHQTKEPLKSYRTPSLPWEIIGVDLFHWNGLDYLALGDSYSGWFDFASLADLTASAVITVLKRQFSIHGIPRVVISDNAKQFDCHAFSQFAQAWDFQHITSSPLYPQSNGLAENSVKRAKLLLEKTKREGSDLHRNLLNMRNIPAEPNLGSPSQRLMSRRLRTTVPTATTLLKPKVKTHVKAQLQKKHQQQKSSYDKSAQPLRPLKPGQVVRLQTPKGHDKLGVVTGTSGDPRSYLVSVQGTVYRRNRRHILPVSEPPPPNNPVLADDFYLPYEQPPVTPPQPVVPPQPQPVVTRSGRVSKPNPRYC